MAENDWDILLKWNNDPEVLYFAEGDDVASHSLEEIQGIYRSTSQNAICFIIEFRGQPVGECWLQQMNLDRIRWQYPHMDCRRIDLMIGEKVYWGQGICTRVIRLLTRFGFEEERAGAVFGCDIADYNIRSRRAFQRVGFEFCGATRQSPG